MTQAILIVRYLVLDLDLLNKTSVFKNQKARRKVFMLVTGLYKAVRRFVLKRLDILIF